jgi:uncharacterized Zn finger protein
MAWWAFPSYVSVAERRAKALRILQKFQRTGQKMLPVQTAGRAIASTFWGKAWCGNLESYSDFSNRLPRGRSYVRNGLVVDLQIEPGQVTSKVSGTELYNIEIKITPLASVSWKKIKKNCGREIGSLVELLQGKLSKSVMEIVTARDQGLFPSPGEIKMRCSCPDWAGMCKHLAATLYGVGARLDHQPELLFKLRQVDHMELITQAANPVARQGALKKKTIATSDLAEVFGIELDVPVKLGKPSSPAKVVRRKKVAGPPAQLRSSKRRRKSMSRDSV